jgi:hypothetical protein
MAEETTNENTEKEKPLLEINLSELQGKNKKLEFDLPGLPGLLQSCYLSV